MFMYRFLLILTAAIWGSAFVAQRIAADSMGPYWFNTLRFTLATVSLFAISYTLPDTKPSKPANFSIWIGGLLIGLFLFLGSTLQQASLSYTSAGKAGFITALYIVLVPVLGLLFFRQPLSYLAMGGVLSAMIGISLLTITSNFTIEWGDMLLLISTVCWAGHILALDYVSPRFKGIRLSAIQFAVAAFLSLCCALLFETITLPILLQSIYPLLYVGLVSSALGFTIQLICQSYIPPTQTSLLISLEMVFAALAGWFFLGETLSNRELWGVVFISMGVLLAQLPTSARFTLQPFRKKGKLVPQETESIT